ncbi:hypothetical protein BU26DRAFT_298580 [Trematosphaeria pertusa]|uniref:Uncharacterized protein n=1 Tax=Trematosphaeria pertusa TaxID=390896 RepID=A0A6A6IL95_9PLEO|nr:uncharacterized protein BU26DRAFT_298580 [Trematosphaeria pertusa]KAF2250263.1 hypothetical protein BU26DRAFT_298580 [Trematosphaeria pertusa]
MVGCRRRLGSGAEFSCMASQSNRELSMLLQAAATCSSPEQVQKLLALVLQPVYVLIHPLHPLLTLRAPSLGPSWCFPAPRAQPHSLQLPVVAGVGVTGRASPVSTRLVRLNFRASRSTHFSPPPPPHHQQQNFSTPSFFMALPSSSASSSSP